MYVLGRSFSNRRETAMMKPPTLWWIVLLLELKDDFLCRYRGHCWTEAIWSDPGTEEEDYYYHQCKRCGENEEASMMDPIEYVSDRRR